MNLSKALIDEGHHVTLWSSDFDHFSKQHRFGTEKTINFSDQLTIRLIKSRGYKSHVGLSRLFDHAQLGWNLRKMLQSASAPEVAFIGYPPIEPAWILSRWLNLRGVPTILDVKDAWPDNLVNAFPNHLRRLAKLTLFPYFLMMNQTFKASTGISSVSQEFLNWCHSKANRKQIETDFVFPLSPVDEQFSEYEIKVASEWLTSLGKLPENKLQGYFVGSLNDAFDFNPIISAAQKFPINFILAGDGPRLDSLRLETKDIPNIIFPGRVSRVQAKVLSADSHFALAPLAARTDFEMSIPNKFYDALQLGKPIISSLTGPSRDLLEKNTCGFYYENEEEFHRLLQKLIENSDTLVAMGNNALDIYIKEYSFNEIYPAVVKRLKVLADDY
jgi:glycosyltransferase involved in cell wall biosynthesis